MTRPPRALSLLLYGEAVARLIDRTGARTRPLFELQFETAYVEHLERPVLTLKCQDWRLDRARRYENRLPAFLENLLPEQDGALRKRIARLGAFDLDDDFALLEFVGGDLAGAITVIRAELPMDTK